MIDFNFLAQIIQAACIHAGDSLFPTFSVISPEGARSGD